MVLEKAYAKLNLTLGVLYKRTDGYHALDSLMVTLDLCDIITVEKAKEIDVVTEGAVLPYENTMRRAAALYKNLTGCGAIIRCKKRLPSEAGMGGGSADAAAVLRALQRLYRMATEDELSRIALQVGADVPFCLRGGLCRCEGVGEILTPVPCPTMHFCVVKPEPGVSTGALFRALPMPRPRVQTLRAMELLAGGRVREAAPLFENALEAPAEVLVPEIGAIRAQLLENGALAARMTGSGSAVFGLFGEEAAARSAVEALGERYPYVACARSTDPNVRADLLTDRG